jgi:MATE family multidrug resistance protein
MGARRAEARALVALAAPIALASLGQQLLGVIDIAMLGRFSDVALAGSGMAAVVLLAVTVVGIGSVLGLDSLIPQALGAGEHERAYRLFAVGTRLAVGVGVPSTAHTPQAPRPFAAFGVTPAVAAEGTSYLYARLPSIIPMLAFTAARSYLQAMGRTRPIVIAIVGAAAVNIVSNYVLIFGDAGLVRLGLPALGVPALGAVGAGLTTVFASIAQLVVVRAAARWPDAAPRNGDDRALARHILALGLPVGFQLAAEVGVFGIASLLAGRLGTLASASHQVALPLASIMFSLAVGLGSAAAVRVGRAVGAGDGPGTRRAGTTALAAAVVLATFASAVLLTLPASLARLVTDDRQVIDAATGLIRIAAVFQWSDVAQAVGAGALRGAGDTRAAFVGNALGHYLVGLPIAVGFAFGLDLGAPGLWWGLSAGLTAVALALWARFFALVQRPIARL